MPFRTYSFDEDEPELYDEDGEPTPYMSDLLDIYRGKVKKDVDQSQSNSDSDRRN